jgi:hypothetical protein
MPWSTPFPKPLRVQDVELATLDDARKLIKLLPKDIRAREPWSHATEILDHAAAGREPPESAMVALWLAMQMTPELRNAT